MSRSDVVGAKKLKTDLPDSCLRLSDGRGDCPDSKAANGDEDCHHFSDNETL